MLLDIGAGQALQSHRPSVIEMSGFVHQRIALGQIVKVADLPDEATEAEFSEFWEASENRELAISSYLSKFEDPAPVTSTRKKGK